MTVLPPITVGGTFADRYRIVRVIKSGGMGAVYEVLDPRTSLALALKVMHPDLIGDQELRARFEQEARVTGGIDSDYIVRTFDAGIDAATNTPFIVMELLRGDELGQRLKDSGAIAPALAVELLAQAASALDLTHAQGIVHRDLKPENMFVVPTAAGGHAIKILDFGVAKVLAEGTSKTTKALGTPLYMPVEQIQGSRHIGPEADRYALAHIAYAMLTGEPYWREEAREIGVIALCLRVATGMPEPATVRAKRRTNLELPSGFDDWFERAAAVQAVDRYKSSGEMIDDLRRVMAGGVITHGAPIAARSERFSTPLTLQAVEGLGSEASGPTSLEPKLELPPAPPSRPRKLTMLVVPAVAALVVVGVWLGQRSDGSPSPAPAAAVSSTSPVRATPAAPSAAAPETVAVAASASTSASASAVASSTAAARAGAVARPHTAGGAAPAGGTAKKGDQWSIY